MNVEWLSVKENLTLEEINKTEDILKIKYPLYYKNIVLLHNRGVPRPNQFIVSNKERVFNRLLSLTENVELNVFSVYEIICEYGLSNLIPFANDPFGNYICFDYTSEDVNIIFVDMEKIYNNETYKGEYICKNIEELFSMFY